VRAGSWIGALAIALAVTARAAESERSIAEMTTDVQNLQTRMAAGDKSAYPLVQERLRAIETAIADAKPEVWGAKAETDALAIYLLSGGQPRDVARLLERGEIPASEDPLVRGALAYASGREGDAEGLLGGIDPRKVSLRLAGQLAYAQSVLLTTRDPRNAIALLDLARTFSPGSLVEEATLRREILLLCEQRDGDRVVFLARQYVSRFGRSVYAESFLAGLAAATVKFGLGDDVAGFGKFATVLTLVTPEQRRTFLLTVARAEIINGNYGVGGAAAADALRDAPPASVDEARARFYAATAQFIGQDYDAGVAALDSLDRSRLPKPDQTLFAAVAYSAAHWRDEPTPAAFAEAGREDQVDVARSSAAKESRNADPVNQTIERAEGDLAQASAIRGKTP
jgi:chemotaxis protein MotC